MSECLKFAENQMANTFFGFNTTLNDHAERLGSSPEDIEGLEAEEEYDALNDETFGALETEGDLDDWEAQHEQLAEIAESSRHSNDIESFLDQLGLDDDSVVSKDPNVWTYNSDLKNGDKNSNSSVLDSKLLPSVSSDVTPSSRAPGPPLNHRGPPQSQAPKLRTVEELERMLLNQSKPGAPVQQHGGPHGGPRFPPGFQPLMMNNNQNHPWPPTSHIGPGGPQNMPPGMVRVMGHGGHAGGRGGGPPPPPGFMGYPPQHGQPYPMPPHFTFPPPPHLPPLPPGLLPPRPGPPHPKHPYPPNHIPPHPHHRPPNQPPHPQHHPQHPPHQAHHHHPQAYQQHNHNHHQQQAPPPPPHQQQQHGGPAGPGGEARDEYAGLMNNREKQWLLNIQLLQVNTGTPYFDDYYYTVFKERQAKNKETQSDQRMNQRYHNRGNVRDGNVGHHHHRGGQNHAQNQVQEQQNPVKKTYTPLQFENSLGKLQFGSVTAPRKIIDMDIISTSDPDPQVSRDSRKTKQLLLELEALYSLLLKAEDLRNPVAVSNQEKLVELRQKQRLREMDAAPTPEQKQEVLRLLQAESLTPRETPQELLSRLLSSLLDAPQNSAAPSSDRLASFLAVRKGKMLILRALPQLALHGELFSEQLRELWSRVLAALPVVGRRDQGGDNVLVRLHPHFKKFINITELDHILDLVSSLIEIMKLENNRSTPLSHQSKAPLHFILQNKFGISAIASILHRADTLLVSCSDKQLYDWSTFLAALIDTLSLVSSATSPPLEPISEACLQRHLDRVGNISGDKRKLLEKIFLDL